MEQQHLEAEKQGPMKLIFNYENVFYSFFYDDISGCIHRSREYAMNYVYSGEMVLDNGQEQIHVGKGECVFIPRDHHITMYKKPAGGERYCGIFLSFTRSFLREMYTRFGPYKVPPRTPKLDSGVIKLPHTAEITSLFSSLTPFFDPEVKPQADFMHLKLQEGLLALLHIDKRFAPTLFDLLGWSYRSGFFGRSILSLRPGEGRAWISTYQILGRLEEGGLVTLEPVRESSVLAWSSAEGLGGPLDEEEKRARLERTVADYQLAGDLFARGGLKEEEVLR